MVHLQHKVKAHKHASPWFLLVKAIAIGVRNYRPWHILRFVRISFLIISARKWTREMRTRWKKDHTAHGPNDSPVEKQSPKCRIAVHSIKSTTYCYFELENVVVLLWSMISWKIKECVYHSKYARENCLLSASYVESGFKLYIIVKMTPSFPCPFRCESQLNAS